MFANEYLLTPMIGFTQLLRDAVEYPKQDFPGRFNLRKNKKIMMVTAKNLNNQNQKNDGKLRKFINY